MTVCVTDTVFFVHRAALWSPTVPLSFMVYFMSAEIPETEICQNIFLSIIVMNRDD